ncbi:hypothetical protein GFS24_28075 [Chitinophaga sp. SYP-B3965]|uniref:hypothetical protein n=1 Tax=Chitinophaga sp. SYP-B3965 TaxID=2663120 RepID=UPI00129981DF|nr:hypothetical protein [Chitinophaga sp. SYP-B3965]MRG48999.1 hypothetical protein [Chitinophaga sp. SYP-B3965]
MLFNTSLWFHIIGISLMAGVTVADFVLTRKFWAFYVKSPQEGILVRKISNKLPVLIIAGILLILLSGVGMMIATHGVFDTFLWFRIKMGLVLLVILNAVIFGRRQNTQLNKLLLKEIPEEQLLKRIQKNLNTFHITQLTLFAFIYLLSTFKFN